MRDSSSSVSSVRCKMGLQVSKCRVSCKNKGSRSSKGHLKEQVKDLTTAWLEIFGCLLEEMMAVLLACETRDDGDRDSSSLKLLLVVVAPHLGWYLQVNNGMTTGFQKYLWSSPWVSSVVKSWQESCLLLVFLFGICLTSFVYLIVIFSLFMCSSSHEILKVLRSTSSCLMMHSTLSRKKEWVYAETVVLTVKAVLYSCRETGSVSKVIVDLALSWPTWQVHSLASLLLLFFRENS